MRNLSKQSLFAIAMACGLSVAGAQESAPQAPGSATGAPQSGPSTAQPASPSATSPTTAAPAPGTATSPAGGTSEQTAESQTQQDGVVKYGGAVMFVKYGKPQRVENEMKLSEGITVQPSGEIELKDGTKMTLQEGQMVTLDSQVTTIPPAMINTLKSPGGTQPSPSGSPGAGGAGGTPGAGAGSTSTTPGAGGATNGASGTGSSPGAAGQPATSGGSTNTGGTTTGGAADGQ